MNGAPFYVMEFVDGLVVRDAKAAQQLTPEQRGRAGESIVDTLARIHAVDPDAVGLGDARAQGGLHRPAAEALVRASGRARRRASMPAVDEVHDRLQAATPEQGPATIVHGDYRLDNCMVGHDGRRASRCSTGSSAPSATRWPTSGC